MKVNTYVVLTEAIEKGIAFGVNRSFKHSECPSQDTLKDNVYREVMNSLFEYFTFEKDAEK